MNSIKSKIPRPKGKTLSAVLDDYALADPEHQAIFYGGKVISYGELLEDVIIVAKSLASLGVRKGVNVGVLFGNEPRWVILTLAISMIGATCVPLNTWYKQTELAWTMRHCGIRVLVSASSFLKTDYCRMLGELAPELKHTRGPARSLSSFPALDTVVFGDESLPGALDWQSFLHAGESLTAAQFELLRTEVDVNGTAFVLYTSGSTAEPKGVMLTHRGIVENGFDLGQRRNITGADRVWIGTPLFYALGSSNALPATLTAGAALVLQGHFDAGAALEVIEQTSATVYYGTGNMTRALLDHPAYAQQRVATLKKGNAGTMPEYKRLTLVEMGITDAVPAYGLTETYGNATVGLPDDPLEVKLRTNGRPLPGMEFRIVDPVSGHAVPTGETGLILIRGHTTPGYLNNPEETAKAVRPDGFFDTGDLGSLDAEGRLIFHSRLKEVLKSGGINISPVEVEQLLASHPDVRDAWVVGVPDPVLGDLVVAFVDAVRTISVDQLRAFVRERAASFKVPHHIFFRTEAQLPRLATGKVAKHRLEVEARQEIGGIA